MFIGDISRLMRRLFDARLRRLDLSYAQAKVLLNLAKTPGMRQASLSDRMEIQPITLGRLIDRMERAGWIERRADPSDRRAVNLFLRDKATPYLDQLRDLLEELQDQALAGLSEAQIAQMFGMLQGARDNLVRLTLPEADAEADPNSVSSAPNELSKVTS